MRTLIILLFLAIMLEAHAQETMYVPPGSTIFIGKTNPVGVFGYVRNSGNISIENAGQLYFLGKIWMNEPGAKMTDGSTIQNSKTGGTVYFTQPNPVFGNQGQQLFEAGYNDLLASGISFSNIVIDNAAGVMLSSDLSLLNSLHFRRGHLYASRYTIAMGDSTAPGTITGYDESRFVVTSNNTIRGFLKFRSVATNQSATFPIGPLPNTYLPLQLLNNSVPDDFFASSFPTVYSQGTTGSIVIDSTLPATWIIGKKRPENADIIVSLQHGQALEDPVFTANRTKSYVSLFAGGNWDKPFVFTGFQTPGSITSSFPIQTAFINNRKLVVGSVPLFLTKRVSKAARALSIPNVFSPNGDNINDRWVINGLTEFPSCVVEVYNRYGQRVFRSVGYQQPWDGTIAGKPLPVGTFYYVIDIRNGDEPMSGHITILK
jgi:gliding motility-associated-like protein